MYLGFYKALVSNTNDPENRGRIKCLIPEVLGDKYESAWCEPCVPVAYDNGGDFCLPNLQETVWVTFEKGDPNRPVYLGGWWRKNLTPLGTDYSKDREKIRIINYANCTILMKDGIININVGEGLPEITIKNSKVEIQGSIEVTGSIKANSLDVTNGISCSTLNASGSVNAPNIP